MDEPATIRPYRPADRAALREIAWETGLLGRPAAPVMPDRELFADLFTTPYTDFGLKPGLVAEAGGTVLGYIVGSSEPTAASSAYVRVAWLVAGGLLRGRYRRLWACLPYLAGTILDPKPHPREAGGFPAHLHINLRAAAQGRGLGTRLLDAFLDELRARGVPGVQLSTTSANAAALRLYARRGFRLKASVKSPLFSRLEGRPVDRVVLALNLRDT